MSTDNGPDLSGRATSGRKLIAVVHADMVGYSRLSRVRVGAQLIDAETRPSLDFSNTSGLGRRTRPLSCIFAV